MAGPSSIPKELLNIIENRRSEDLVEDQVKSEPTLGSDHSRSEVLGCKGDEKDDLERADDQVGAPYRSCCVGLSQASALWRKGKCRSGVFGRERKALQQAELYRNFLFLAYEKRVQPSIFVCEFIDPGNLVLRVTDKVNYPATEWMTPRSF
ncbi:unnamed protein product [Lupinus luteus]|uniref:Uncharacterized protein n=1 Tax=Lupinus luteus TaxID=3873 RepID=A0AAV1WZZ2_LUPLU